MSKAIRIEAPIKGPLGNVVNVGDTVMVVTTGYSHNVSVNKGKYLGYIKGTGYYTQRAQVEVEYTSYVQFKPDGTEFDWSKDYNHATYHEVSKTLTRKEVTLKRVSTLNLNRIATITPAEAVTVEALRHLI